MNSRERVRAALDFKPVDKIPLEYHPSFRGLYEHGDELRALIKGMPGDFEDVSDWPVPVPAEGTIDSNGNYHEFTTDKWGVEWENHIFAMMGQAKKHPLADLSKLDSYVMPAGGYDTPESFDALCKDVARIKEYGYCKRGFVGIFELLHALCPFENVLMDMYEESPELDRLADMLTDYLAREVDAYIKAGVDAIQFGDDYGTQRAMMMAPDVWKRFFVPRYERLMKPIRDAGIDIQFHSCGYIEEIIPELARLGVRTLWPQLSVYDPPKLAKLLRDHHVACQVHIDRAGIMTAGTPADVERAVHGAVNNFDLKNGGGWFYIEIDNGFPIENIRALFKAIGEYR